MMQNLFGEQSEDEEEEEEVDSEHESNQHRPNYVSDENDGGLEQEEQEVEGEAYVEGQGEAEGESEGDFREEEPEVGESEGEREQSFPEVEAGEQQEESEARETDSEEKEEYAQRVVTSRRRDVVDSGSERSEEQEPRYVDPEDEEVGQTGSPGGSPEEEMDHTHVAHSTAEIRDVFGDSDEEEPAEFGVQHDLEQQPMSPVEEEESYEKNLRPDDLVRDDDAQYPSEEEFEAKLNEKPVGPPMELEIPLRPPPAHSDKMNMIRVSNIMGIDPKPFDPKTYEEEDVFVTDESGTKKRIRLENNVVRWRTVKKADGKLAYESNARFVRWSDGSLQLMIGNEVLDITVQDARHDNAHLFVRHGKGILQSQGKLLRKMRFMPSSLASNSHRLLTALVDSRHKKVYKVKNCITDVDPEREKEQKEKAESQTHKANQTLIKKRERVNRKYSKPAERGRQLSPGFLEEALDEDEEYYNDSRRPASRRRFEDELELEARAEKRIINAKKAQGLKDVPRKSSNAANSSRRPVDFSDSEREESEYETEGEEEERSPERKMEDSEPEWEDSEEEQEEAAVGVASEEEAEEPHQTGKEARGSLKRKEIESDEESPPSRKPTAHRRMAVVYDSDEE